MARDQFLTDKELLTIIKQSARRFKDDDCYILLSTDSNNIKKFIVLANSDLANILKKRDTVKKRAQEIVLNLWAYSHELFILVAIAIDGHTTKLGKLDWSDYIHKLSIW
jgi:ribosome biogenesis GTPase A